LGQKNKIRKMKMRSKYKISFLILLFVWLSSGSKLISQNTTIAHDPVAIKVGNTFHIFCTGNGITTYTSQDLISWTKGSPIFKEKPSWVDEIVPDFKNHIWAPDISYHNNKYYLYYSISSFGKNTSAIGLTTNVTLDQNDPLYKWEDQGIVIQSIPGRDMWNAIDPNLVIDKDGTPWLTFGSFWSGMKIVKLTKSLNRIHVPEEWLTIARKPRSPQLTDEDPGDGAIEAPFIFKKGEFYYLFVSWDYCCRGEKSTYKVVVGRSKDIKGPYLDNEGKSMFDGGGSLVVQGDKSWYGAGHNSVYTFDNQDYMFFHAYDDADNGKPKLRVSTVGWDENFWPFIQTDIFK
jgi:arabinan endo-1,5-alpha-L-arabinosidase